MYRRENHPVRSKVHVGGHPIHPLLVPFPIAFIIGALATDIVYAVTNDSMWANFSYWLLWGGVGMGLLAAVFGLTDFLGIERVRGYTIGWVHFLGNLIVVAVAAINAALRIPDPVITGNALTIGIVLSVITALGLIVTGWAGGELIYRHRIAVIPQSGDLEEHREEPPSEYRRAA